jgi:hypothetical protein
MNPESRRQRSDSLDRSGIGLENENERLVWMSSKEAANYLRKSAGAIRVMVFRGQIRVRKYKRRLYFKRRELDQLLEASHHGGY